ncbi:Uncharacterised protein [Vibrio cholerae]|nr:Uncharacterised protein [Vibrio cholerae]CSI74389.1 Uncharacterised protein [Vibrio cholerae]
MLNGIFQRFKSTQYKAYTSAAITIKASPSVTL